MNRKFICEIELCLHTEWNWIVNSCWQDPIFHCDNTVLLAIQFHLNAGAKSLGHLDIQMTYADIVIICWV